MIYISIIINIYIYVYAQLGARVSTLILCLYYVPCTTFNIYHSIYALHYIVCTIEAVSMCGDKDIFVGLHYSVYTMWMFTARWRERESYLSEEMSYRRANSIFKFYSDFNNLQC